MAYIQCRHLLLLGLSLLLMSKASYAQSYKALVVAHHPKYELTDLPSDIEVNSKNEYVSLIKDAAGQDIVVFPEHGITSLTPIKHLHANLDPFSMDVPEAPSTQLKDHILADIASAARSSGVYVVLNVLEKSNSKDYIFYYSTDIVIDPSGVLVAKCRKKYINGETYYDKGDTKQSCTFEAKFKRTGQSVKFALLFDTDVLYSLPSGEKIYDAILTSSLKNKLPIAFGLSLHLGFSIANGVNLLVSGYADTNEGHGGSGIYLRNGTSWVTLKSGSFLSKEVPIDRNERHSIKVVSQLVESDNLQKVAYEKLPMLPDTSRTVSRNFNDGTRYCKMEMDSTDIAPYRWVGLSSNEKLLNQSREVVICALIKPAESRSNGRNIGNVYIEAAAEKDNIIQVLPLSLSSANSAPVGFQFEEKIEGSAKIVKTKLDQGDMSIFGVILVLNDGISFGTSLHASQISLVGFLSIFAYLWSKYVT